LLLLLLLNSSHAPALAIEQPSEHALWRWPLLLLLLIRYML
jgi:hypothetical protein